MKKFNQLGLGFAARHATDKGNTTEMRGLERDCIWSCLLSVFLKPLLEQAASDLVLLHSSIQLIWRMPAKEGSDSTRPEQTDQHT
jgi:hypothetical protein